MAQNLVNYSVKLAVSLIRMMQAKHYCVKLTLFSAHPDYFGSRASNSFNVTTRGNLSRGSIVSVYYRHHPVIKYVCLVKPILVDVCPALRAVCVQFEFIH